MTKTNTIKPQKNKGRFTLLEKATITGCVIEGISSFKIAELINRSVESVNQYIQSLDIEKLLETYSQNIIRIQNRDKASTIKEPNNDALQEYGIVTRVNNNNEINWVNAPRSYNYH